MHNGGGHVVVLAHSQITKDVEFEGREGFGFHENGMHILCCAGGFFRKVMRVFFTVKNTRRTLGQTVSDVEAALDECNAVSEI
jgi:hypothetical protein